MVKKKVLFVCIHNSARSQMAEEILRQSGSDKFEVESAGIERGTLNPFVIEVLKEQGIDISGKKTKSVFDLFNEGKSYDYVVTVCDESSAGKCPVFPGIKHQIHWAFEDPSRFKGTKEEKLARTRVVRDQVREKIEEWVNKG